MMVHRASLSEINIVNNYSHYGQSLVSCKSSRTGSKHSVASNDDSNKRFKANFSYKSLITEGKKLLLKQQRLLTVAQLPEEVVRLVILFTNDKRTVLNCCYVSRLFNAQAKQILFQRIDLVSTYRLAQLVSSLKEFPNGRFVKLIDLSHLQPGAVMKTNNDNHAGHGVPEGHAGHANNAQGDGDETDDEVEYAWASWRDWKFKGDPLYGSDLLNSYNLSKSKSTISYNSVSTKSSISNRFVLSFKKLLRKFCKREIALNDTDKFDTPGDAVTQRVLIDPNKNSHPYTNKFFLKYANLKDVPIGYILYLLEHCYNVEELNFNGLTLSEDFYIVPNMCEKVLTVQFQMNFFSDVNVNKFFNYNFFDMERVKEIEIFKKMSALKSLNSVKMSNVLWINYKMIDFLINSLTSTPREINFERSGLLNNSNWAINSNYEYFKKLVNNELPQQEEAPNLSNTVGTNY